MATVRCDGVRMAAMPSKPPGTLENLRDAVRCYIDYLSGGSGDTPLSQVLLKDNVEQAMLEWGIAGCPGDKTEGPLPERAPELSKGGVAEFLDGLTVCPQAVALRTGAATVHHIGDGFARHICSDSHGNPIVQLEPGGPLYCLAFGELAFIEDKGTVVKRVKKAPAVDSP